jgi:hypothetical protein
MQPYVRLAEQRAEMEASIESTYSTCLSEFTEFLQREKRKLEDILEKVMAKDLSLKIISISKGKYEDT